MPKFKRLLVPGEYLTAADMLDVVSQQNISAAAVQGMILLAAQPPVAWLLDCCCFGKVVAQDLEVFDIRRTTNGSSQSSGDGNDFHGGAAATAALEVVAAVAGVNVASQELQQQYQHHMREVLVRRQRRAKSAADRSNSSTTVLSDIAAATTTDAQPVVITSAATNAPVLQHQQECPQQQQQMGEQAGAAAQVASCMRSSPLTAAAAAELEAADHKTAEVAADSTASGCLTALGIASAAPVALNSCCSSHAAVAATSTQGVGKQLQLVQLSSQEAFFLVHVLHCCQITAVDMAGEPSKLNYCCTQEQQHQQQHGCQGDGTISIQESQQQQQQHSGHLLHVFRHPTHHGSETMSTEQLWQWCCENSAGDALTFTSQYAAYHHFRSKGWIPQPGLNFGADFVLYELHPEYAHSDYAVLVMTQVIEPSLGEDLQCPAADNSTPLPLASTRHVTGAEASNETQLWNLDIKHQLDIASSSNRWTADDSGNSHRGPTYSSSQLQWLDAHIMQRLARQVLKQLLLFYVVLPQGLPLESPSCLQHLSVREILMQRWQPSAAGNRGFK